MKVKCFVDRFKNFEVSSSKIRTIMIESFFKKMGFMNYAINVDPE